MWIRGGVALVCWVLASPTWAALSIDAASSAVNASGNTTSHSHTFAANANFAAIGLSLRDGLGAVGTASVVGVTVGGQAATFLCGVGTTNVRAEIWYKSSPLTGSQTVAADASNGAHVDQIVTGVVSFEGANLADLFEACGEQTITTSTNADVDSLASAVGQIGFLVVSTNTGPTCAADATSPVSTEQWDRQNGGNHAGCGYTEAGAATSINMRVDLSASVTHVAKAVSIRPLASTRHHIEPIWFK